MKLRTASYIFAAFLLCVAATAEAVTRTGQNNVKIPLAPGNVRISCPECTEALPAADRTICSSGCDATNTTANITTAINAGGITEGRTATPGGTESWNAKIVCSGHNNWHFRVRDGDTIRLDGADYGINIDNCDNAIVEGNSTGRTGLELGNPANWSDTTPTNTAYPAIRQIQITNSSGVIIRNLTTHGATNFTANLIDRTNTLMMVDNIAANLHGTNCPGTGSGPCTADAAGDLFVFGPNHSVFQNSTVNMGGHNALSPQCYYCIIRNNDLSNDWTSKNTGAPGYRIVEINNEDTSNWIPANSDPGNYGPLLFENNIAHTVNAAGTTRAHSNAIKAHGLGIIFRGNFIWDDLTGQAINAVAFLGTVSGERVSRLHLYNNTLYNTQGLLYTLDNQFSSEGTHNCREYKIYNNIIAQAGDNGEGTGSAVIWDTNACADTANADGYPNGLKGGAFDSNIINGPSTKKTWNLTMRSGSGTISWANTTSWPDSASGYIARNQDVSTTFVNAASPSKANLALAPTSAAGVGDARWVTTTTDSGTADTTLTLADSWFFKDAWAIDLTSLGEPAEVGDWIAVTPTSGGTITDAVCTQITSNTPTTGAIVVSPGVTHAVGSKVWPAGDGTTCNLWRNRGAAQ